MANTSILAAFERMWQHIVLALSTKVDKEEGKGLSANDFTDEDKQKIETMATTVNSLSSTVSNINSSYATQQYVINAINNIAIYKGE